MTATTWTGIAGGVAAILIIGYLNHNNIKLSSTVIGVLMIGEATFVAAVALVIVIQGGHLGHFSADPFNPRAATAGFAGLSLAAIFAFLSIAGVDSVAPVAEEARTPRRLIPLATILITVIAGAYWTLTSIAGIFIDGYVLYKGFFVSEISLPFKSGSSIVWFSLAWAVLGIGWALWWSRRRRLDSISLSAEV